MRIPNLYDALNFLDTLSIRARAFVFRKQFDVADTDGRAGVYARAQKRYDNIVQGGDLVNLAPVPVGEPLFYVQETDHAQLRELGAVQRDGQWLMPNGFDDQTRWVFKKWFPRATKDLETKGSKWQLTIDGRPTNGYILPEDLRFGADSTATSLVMGAFPVLFALGYALWQIPVLGPWLAVGICGPLLVLHALVLRQCEDTATLLKVIALSGGVPLLLLGGDPTKLMSASGIGMGGTAGLGLVMLIALTFAFKGKSKSGQSVFSFFTTLKHIVGALILVFALNFALGLLPESLNFLKPFGLFVVACAYPLYYTLGNFVARTAQLELQSKHGAGSLQSQNAVLGKLAPVRLQTIRAAARDTSPFLTLGYSKGVLVQSDLAIAPEYGQVMGLTLHDLSTHLHVFGATGTGKTSSILRPLALQLAKLPQQIGWILSDGKGAMVADMRPFLDIVIEPGTKFAPFQGMTAEEVAGAFAETNNESMSNKDDSLWVKSAGTFHLFALTILEALVAHERLRKQLAIQRMNSLQHQIESLCAEKVILQRKGADLTEVQACLDALTGLARITKTDINAQRQYRWTPGAYASLKNILAVPVMGAGGVWRASAKTTALFDFLGYNPTDEKKSLDPMSVHPDLMATGRVLSRAITYFNETWPAIDEKLQSSYLANVDQDILGFLKSDKLRGSLLEDGKVGTDEAWADTEEGVDITQVVFGKRLGVNLPATQYKTMGKLITKLVKTRIFREIRVRAETHGDDWREATGQAVVMDMTDECQDMVSPMEIDLTATARSMGLFFVYATQQLESLNKVMPSIEAKLAYLENFRSLVLFKSSVSTYTALQARAGPVKKKKLPVSVQATVDTSRAIDTYQNTIYTDPNHPSAVALRDLNRRGATRLQVITQGANGQNLGGNPWMGLGRRLPLEELQDQNWIPVWQGGQYEDGKVLEETDLHANLAIQGSAVLYINRASHDRIDFATTTYMSAKDAKRQLAQHKAS